MQFDTPDQPIPFSLAAIALGGAGLVIALLVVFAGPFTPQPDIGTQIGEIAGNMRAAAWRSFFGLEQPETTIVQPQWDTDRILMVAAPAVGVLGILAAIIAFIRREPRRFAAYGLAVSVCAVFVQALLAIVLIIAGVMLLIAIIQNLDSIFGF